MYLELLAGEEILFPRGWVVPIALYLGVNSKWSSMCLC